MRIQKETILRTVVMILALVNSVLLMMGKNPIPYSNDELYVGLSSVVTVLSTLWSWWKNNSFTNSALIADEYLKDLKGAERKNEYI